MVIRVRACIQARGAPLLVDRTAGVPLAPESRPLEVLNTPEARATFNAGKGGPLAVSANGGNGVVFEGESYTTYSNVALPGDGGDIIASLCGVNPTSRGSVRAVSTNPRDAVRLHTNVLGNANDVDHGMRCLKRLQDIHTELTPMLGLESLVPGPQAHGKVLEEDALRFAILFNHFVASCAVGEVVDNDFKVIGVDGLRVVDASVQPEMPPFAGPAATVYMIAELASEIIIAAHK